MADNGDARLMPDRVSQLYLSLSIHGQFLFVKHSPSSNDHLRQA